MLRLLLTVVVLVAMVAGGLLVYDRSQEDTPTGASSDGTDSVFDLRVGDCLVDIASAAGEQRGIDAAPCDEPHDGEVYTSIDLGDGAYPGNDFVQGKARRGCPARLRRQAPDFDGEVTYFTPTERSWTDEDDHAVTCIAVYPERRTGTVVAQRDGA